MMDLRNHLDEIAGPLTPVSSDDVEADILRGRRALRRRRTVQTAAASAFGVAALVAAFAVPSGGVGGRPQGPPAAATSAGVVTVDLVAYQGAQPKGFTLDKVPAGWFIQADDNYGLILAPEKAKNPKPGVNPSTEPLYDTQSFVGKIGIMLESKDQSGPGRAGDPVRIGDRDGVLLKSLPAMVPGQTASADGDTGWEIWVKQPSGVYLLVQFWEGIGLSRDQMVELTAGVHVHKDAVQGVG